MNLEQIMSSLYLKIVRFILKSYLNPIQQIAFIQIIFKSIKIQSFYIIKAEEKKKKDVANVSLTATDIPAATLNQRTHVLQ